MKRRAFLKLFASVIATASLDAVAKRHDKEQTRLARHNPHIGFVIDSEGKAAVGTIQQAYLSDKSIIMLERQGWLLCDGRALDKNKYAALFAAIGTSYGSTKKKFKVPDLSHYDPYKHERTHNEQVSMDTTGSNAVDGLR